MGYADELSETIVIGRNRTTQSARAMFAEIPFLKTASRDAN